MQWCQHPDVLIAAIPRGARAAPRLRHYRVRLTRARRLQHDNYAQIAITHM